jgi:diaminohydroxyphosphoribosylaminopyrimidine deaminase/5-amino-6-(5-phosphoribosylamino)uracil reductase
VSANPPEPLFPPQAHAADPMWRRVLEARRSGAPDVAEPWRSIFAPLLAEPQAMRVFGQVGQSLDGRVATPSGASHYINGAAAIAHLHRLRALVDAVVVGIGTVVADDPALTVRHVEGASPWRVAIDPRGRIAPNTRLLTDDGCRRIVVTAVGATPALPAGVEHIAVPADAAGRIAPAAIVAALGALGARRILVEGGPFTVSRFVEAGCLDRLHLMVAPLIIGSGPTGIDLPPIDRLDDAMRPPARWHALGDDLLCDLDLAGYRAR